MQTPIAVLALLLGTNATSPAPRDEVSDVVILVSVDGLRSDALIAQGPAALPAFARLFHGPHTLNARADPDYTVTLPNHTSMITSRLVKGPDGHNWIENDEAEPGVTLHSNKQAYIASCLDVIHDRGGWTGLYTGKPKFALYKVSYAADTGAPDLVPPDDGRNKLDLFDIQLDTAKLTDDVIAALTEPRKSPKKFLFVHFAVTDLTAHARGWDVTPGSAYMRAVAEVDTGLGRILDTLEKNEALRGHSAIVLTADHGGGAPFKSHDQAHMWVDYIIPFVVWTGGGDSLDLYAINDGRRKEPGLTRPRPSDPGLPPIRNADAGNLVLSLMGMPAIPGSTVNAKQDLALVPATARH